MGGERGGGGGGGSTAAPKDTIKVRARESCEQSWSGTHHERSGKQGYRNFLLQAMSGWARNNNWNCFQNAGVPVVTGNV